MKALPTDNLRVLVVEDHAPLRAEIAALLRAAGHHVDEAGDGRSGLAAALADPPDVLVLDLGLPALDGLRVCERLRDQGDRHVPVLMLTARDALDDKVGGFAAGADDYLVKPFAGEELLARVRALGRRHVAGEPYLLQLGSLRIDRRSRSAWRGTRPLQIGPTAFSVLLLLAEAAPRALTRSELIARLWDGDPPDSDPLRTHLYQLRQALDAPPATPMLRTIHGVGYRLDVDAAIEADA
jgi:DNA-binding response OmpR family regulator